MKRVSRNNLEQFLHGIHGDINTLAVAMQTSIDEIYENLESLDMKFGAFFQVDEENECITVSGLPSNILHEINEEDESITLSRDDGKNPFG